MNGHVMHLASLIAADFCNNLLRSSVYGPELLKDPTVADDVDVSLGRKKTGEEFETDHVETSKRVRKE